MLTPADFPQYPANLYCGGCGLSNEHWPGCETAPLVLLKASEVNRIRRVES